VGSTPAGRAIFHLRFQICDLRSALVLTLEHLAQVLEGNRSASSAGVKEFTLCGRRFNLNTRPAIMGVVNLSADSWYRESVCLSVESAVARGRVLVAQGADLVDLGAESTLAHAVRADAASQSGRLQPVVRELARSGVLVSVETYEPA
jgi:dihydropteroate synthase